METKKSTYAIVLVAMLLGVVIGLMSAPNLGWLGGLSSTKGATLSENVEALVQQVRDNYVDTLDLDSDSMTAVMMAAMLGQLDPHSYYLSAKEATKREEEMNSNFEGIGILLFYYDDTVFVEEVFEGSPAERAGLLPGDRIVRVDTLEVRGTGITRQENSVVPYIRGPRGTYVKMVVERGAEDEVKSLDVLRDVIFRPTVVASLMLDNSVGYIYIHSFSHTTGYEMRKALSGLLGKGMKHLILDLRDNGGGALETALETAQELLPKGDRILYTEGAHQRRRDYYSDGRGLFTQGGLTVMIDDNSASASEIVAGAVQDNDRGLVVGRRSFGKGLVQTMLEMPGGAMMTLTTARYYTPSGRCIQRPYNKGFEEYYSDYMLRMFVADSVADRLLNTTDTSQTYYTKQGRKVYGGGGIQPDTVLDYEQGGNWRYYNEVVRAHVVDECAMDYLHRRGADLKKKYADVEAFDRSYLPGDECLQTLLRRADAKGIARDTQGIAQHGKDLVLLYKARLAQSLYGGDAYYRVARHYDTDLQRTIKIIAKK